MFYKQTPVKITGYGLAAGCQLFYRKIYGFFFTLQHADKHKNLMRKINFYHCPNAVSTVTKARARGYKTFSLLNSAEHEILKALKYNNVKKFSIFHSDKPRMLFFLLMNVKVPTIVGISTFVSRKKFMLS